MAQRWDLQADTYDLTRTDTRETRTPTHPQCRHHRQSIGENEGNRGTRGYDGGKKIKGRKRHLLVDTTGLILHVLVHEANIQNSRGGKLLLAPLKGVFGRLKLIWAESS